MLGLFSKFFFNHLLESVFEVFPWIQLLNLLKIGYDYLDMQSYFPGKDQMLKFVPLLTRIFYHQLLLVDQRAEISNEIFSSLISRFYSSIVNLLTPEGLFQSRYASFYMKEYLLFLIELENPDKLVPDIFTLILASAFVSPQDCEFSNGIHCYTKLFQDPIHDFYEDSQIETLYLTLQSISTILCEYVIQKGIFEKFFLFLVQAFTQPQHTASVFRLLTFIIFKHSDIIPVEIVRKFDVPFDFVQQSNDMILLISYIRFKIEIYHRFQQIDDFLMPAIEACFSSEDDYLFSLSLDFFTCVSDLGIQIPDIVFDVFNVNEIRFNNIASLSILRSSAQLENFSENFQKVIVDWIQYLPLQRKRVKHTNPTHASYAEGLAYSIAHFIDVHGNNLDFTQLFDAFESPGDFDYKEEEVPIILLCSPISFLFFQSSLSL
jgi:hypothetical protein